MRTEDKIDSASIMQWLGTNNKYVNTSKQLNKMQLYEAVDILVDMFNGDYPVETFRNDVRSSFEPDDRGDINR